MSSQGNFPADRIETLVRRHLLIGWAGLLLFLSLGVGLETLHALKVGYYLDLRNSTRRLMWTLAHSHGTLFSLVHIAFAVSLRAVRGLAIKGLELVSSCLTGALVAMPLGFFLGGLWLYGGDPGIGVLFVPVGALLMVIAAGTFLLGLFGRFRRGGSEALRRPGTAKGEPAAAAGRSRSKRRRG